MTVSGNAQIWTRIYALIQAGTDAASPQIEKLGIDLKEFLVIDRLEQVPSPAELAKSLSIPKATMTGYLKGLEAKGLIDRHINRDDLRRYRLGLTAAGMQKVSQGRAILEQTLEARLAKLENVERHEFARLIVKLTD